MPAMKGAIAKLHGWLAGANRSAMWLTYAAICFYAIIILLSSASHSTVLNGTIGAALVFALPLLGLGSATLLHELGHALAAQLVGWRVWIISVGPFQARFAPHLSMTTRAATMVDAGGFVLPSPRNLNVATPFRLALITAAGPAISVLGALASFAIAQPWLDTVGWAGLGAGVLYAFGLSSLACAVLTLWPHLSPTGCGNDIVQIWRTFRRPRDDRDMFFTYALGAIDFGFSPRHWDQQVRDELRHGDLAGPNEIATAFLDAITHDDFAKAERLAGIAPRTLKQGGAHFTLRAWRDACEYGDFAAADTALASSHGASIQGQWIMDVREITLIGILANAGERDWAQTKYRMLRERLRTRSEMNTIVARLINRALEGPVGQALNTPQPHSAS
jgi:Peptidase family M50